MDQAKYDKLSTFQRFAFNYQRRYIRTGSPAPVFHFIGLVLMSGIFIEAKGHADLAKDPFNKGHH